MSFRFLIELFTKSMQKWRIFLPWLRRRQLCDGLQPNNWCLVPKAFRTDFLLNRQKVSFSFFGGPLLLIRFLPALYGYPCSSRLIHELLEKKTGIQSGVGHGWDLGSGTANRRFTNLFLMYWPTRRNRQATFEPHLLYTTNILYLRSFRAHHSGCSALAMQTRAGVAPCRFCGQQFQRREHLVRHERTRPSISTFLVLDFTDLWKDTREKPFVCSCGKAFSRRYISPLFLIDNMAEHLRATCCHVIRD